MTRELNKYDLLKATAIILVVIGHITRLYRNELHPEMNTYLFEVITRMIYLFHMPLFMVLSGMLYGLQRNKYLNNVNQFVRNKTTRLLIPYLTGSVFLLTTLTILDSSLINHGIIPLIVDRVLLFNDVRHLWFVLALFQIFIFQVLLDRLGIPLAFTFFFSLIIGIVYKTFFTGYFEFAYFHMALQYWSYFIGGILLSYNKNINIRYLYCFVVVMPMTIILRHYTGSILIRSFCEYITAFAIVLLIWRLFEYIQISKISIRTKKS